LGPISLGFCLALSGAMAMHRMYVRNTFLDVEESDPCEPRLSHRSFFSEPLSCPEKPQPALEQATLESLNMILKDSRHLKLASKPPSKTNVAELQPAPSNMIVSTVPVEHLDCNHNQDSQCGSQVPNVSQESILVKGTGLKPVLSCASVSTMAPEDSDCEGSQISHSGDDMASVDERGASTSRFCHGPATQREVLPQRKVYGSSPISKDFSHCRVPKSLNLAEKFSADTVETRPTTMMIRNIPNRYTQRELIAELENLGFGGTFDFLYAPIDFGTMGNVGYVFINFISAEWAARCRQEFEGFIFSKHQKKTAKKVATVSVAHLQGLGANMKHYEKSAVAVRARAKGCGPMVMASLSSVVY